MNTSARAEWKAAWRCVRLREILEMYMERLSEESYIENYGMVQFDDALLGGNPKLREIATRLREATRAAWWAQRQTQVQKYIRAKDEANNDIPF